MYPRTLVQFVMKRFFPREKKKARASLQSRRADDHLLLEFEPAVCTQQTFKIQKFKIQNLKLIFGAQ